MSETLYTLLHAMVMFLLSPSLPGWALPAVGVAGAAMLASGWVLRKTARVPLLAAILLGAGGAIALGLAAAVYLHVSIVLPETVVHLLTLLGLGLTALVITFLNVLILIWVERKGLGRFMDRRAAMHVGYAGLLQNIADGMKLFLKEFLVPKKADRLGYVIAPAAYVATSLIVVAAIPFSPEVSLMDSELLLLFILGIFSMAPFFIFLGGWSANNKYTLIGGVRSAAQLIAYEIPLILSVVAVAVYAGSFSPADIIAAQNRPIFGGFGGGMVLPVSNWFIMPMFLAFLIFFISILAEVERIPFDLPEAEAELVEGWTTEYGSMNFGFIMMGDYIRGFAGAALIAILFLGGWSGPIEFPWSGVFWFILKVYILFFILVWVRASLPRVRTDQLLRFGWGYLMPLSIVSVLLAIVLVYLGWY